MPVVLAFEIIAERRIEEAMAEGKFDRLEFSGVPIDLTDYFNLPAELRMAWTVLRNARCVPTEVEISKEIEELRNRIAREGATDPSHPLVRLLREKEMTFALMLERRKRN